MNISSENRRRRTVVGGAVVALALGGLAAVLPAQASAGPSASAIGGTAASGKVKPEIDGGSPPHGTAVAALIASSITDSLNPSGVTAPDAILTCATSQIAVGGTYAVAVPLGCLTLYNNEWVKVTWTGGTSDVSTEMNLQTNGNLVVTAGNGKTWSAGTTFTGNLEGPGCLAQFHSNADLVVSNCDNELIWQSGSHAYPDAILAFQEDGNVVIYETSAGTALWATSTE